jgi:hypothetical protein
LGQFEASNAVDVSIHLWWGAIRSASVAAATVQRSVLMRHLDVMFHQSS